LTVISSTILYFYTLPFNDFSLSEWLHHNPYQNGTHAEEIRCYSLPYGGIGFLSHVLTYYTITILSFYRRPQHLKLGIVDVALKTISNIITVIISALTMVRWRSRWQFIAIAAWKLDLSLTLGFLSMHAEIIAWNDRRDLNIGKRGGGIILTPKLYFSISIPRGGELSYKNMLKILFWLLLYIPGVAAGMVGLFSLVIENFRSNHHLRLVTYAFSGGLFLLTTLFLVWILFRRPDISEDEIGVYFVYVLSAFLAVEILDAFYSDWVLAAIAGNLTGAPSSDNSALY
jgi:hypothetical protein